MRTKIFRIAGALACVALIITCFIPWVHYNSVNLTFNGVNVIPFDTGNYYGKAGYPIITLTVVIFLLMFVNRIWAKRLNLFLNALLIAYTIRTYIIFTSALFVNEVDKKAGIYLVLILPVIMMVGCLSAEVKAKKEIR